MRVQDLIFAFVNVLHMCVHQGGIDCGCLMITFILLGELLSSPKQHVVHETARY